MSKILNFILFLFGFLKRNNELMQFIKSLVFNGGEIKLNKKQKKFIKAPSNDFGWKSGDGQSFIKMVHIVYLMMNNNNQIIVLKHNTYKTGKAFLLEMMEFIKQQGDDTYRGFILTDGGRTINNVNNGSKLFLTTIITHEEKLINLNKHYTDGEIYHGVNRVIKDCGVAKA
jgi:hypothetical protein